MRSIIFFIIIIISALLIGALASYPSYMLVSLLTEARFHKLVSHTTLLSGLLLSLFYLKLCGVSFKDAFCTGIKRQNVWRDIVVSFSAGALILIAVESCLLSLAIHQPDPVITYQWTVLLKILIKSLLSGLVVALIEETIFRGALLGGLARQTNVMTALIISALIYAAVHFIKYPAPAADVDIAWFTGLEMLSHAFSRFADATIIDAFTTLFTLGLLLGLIRLRTGNIIQCIGLHAGIVTIHKMAAYLTNYHPGKPYDFLVNAYSSQFGYLATACLSLAIILYYIFFMKNKMLHQPHR
ncbi:MAG: CPBP family intramembrane metalloprotease [Gammaproteobacteria bacterium]|nr:CPBP family intramembrane metalloprotease [Gammaproteobacteria bacterium]